MKFVSSREFRIQPGSIWQLLEQGEDIVVTAHGKPLGILIGANEETMQPLLQELVRLRAKLAVTSMRQHAQTTELNKLSDDEIEQLVDDARRAQ